MPDVVLRCACGKVRGGLEAMSPSRTNRVVCYCDDCQSFAWNLKEEGILDTWGGTEICQVSPAYFSITEGMEHVACLKQSPKSQTVRWHTTCCDTPMCNTLQKPRVPFVGVIHTFIDLDEAGMEEAFGPVRAVIASKYATGNREVLAAGESKLGVLWAFRLMAGWWFSGDHKKDMLFPEGVPAIVPIVMSKERRTTLREKCGPNPAG